MNVSGSVRVPFEAKQVRRAAELAKGDLFGGLLQKPIFILLSTVFSWLNLL
jgi:hypothetical protein